MKALKFGDKYRDIVTGVEGVATARSEYMNGCVRIQLEWSKDGSCHLDWFDEQRLVHAKSGHGLKALATAGGPQNDPKPNDPR